MEYPCSLCKSVPWKYLLTILIASFPDSLITPIAPEPGGVDKAIIVLSES